MTLSVEKILRLPAVMEMTGLKRAAIYQAVAERRFPQPIALAVGSRARGWLTSEISAHLRERVAERDAPKRKPKRKRGRA
jgi:prophage regulatory protein